MLRRSSGSVFERQLPQAAEETEVTAIARTRLYRASKGQHAVEMLSEDLFGLAPPPAPTASAASSAGDGDRPGDKEGGDSEGKEVHGGKGDVGAGLPYSIPDCNLRCEKGVNSRMIHLPTA